jgi:hypothetical protein
MAFFLVSNFARATPEQEFWKWFQKNEDSLFNFERDRDRIFDGLTSAIHQVDPNLTFEFGPNIGNHREFVISAEGIEEAFPKVISLYEAAPKLPRWTFIKFRPRRELMDLRYGGLAVRTKDILFTLHSDGTKVGVTLFIPGYAQENRKKMIGIAFLILDQALGEFDVTTDVGSLDVGSTADAPKDAEPIRELSKMFDEIMAVSRSHV